MSQNLAVVDIKEGFQKRRNFFLEFSTGWEIHGKALRVKPKITFGLTLCCCKCANNSKLRNMY